MKTLIQASLLLIYISTVLIAAFPIIDTYSALAQEITKTDVIARNPYPFTVFILTNDGLVSLIPNGEASLQPGRVCLVDPKVYYTDNGVRYRFAGLISDGKLLLEPCVVVARSLEPFYVIEYRLLVVSEPRGVVYEELWGRAGSIVDVSIPRVVEGDFARYTFTALVLPGGVEAPGDNVGVALYSPLTVTAVYRVDYRVVIEGTGREYWYSSGPLVIPVEDLTVVRGGARLVPERLLAGDVAIEVQGGYFIVPEGFHGVLKPVYRKEYLLVVKGPEGERREWIPEGEKVSLEFQSIINVSPEERLVYRGALVDGLRVEAPRIEIVMDSPHRVEALYERQYLVRVRSILGATEEWVSDGSIYTLSLPQVMPGGLFTGLEMTTVVVNGEALPGVEALRLPVDGPLDITVVYSSQPILWRIALALIPATLLSASAALYLYRWLQGGGEENDKEEDNNGVEREKSASTS